MKSKKMSKMPAPVKSKNVNKKLNLNQPKPNGAKVAYNSSVSMNEQSNSCYHNEKAKDSDGDYD